MSKHKQPKGSKKKQSRRWKLTTARKWNGDDEYSWAIFSKTNEDIPIVSGLSRTEVAYEREKIEDALADHKKALKEAAKPPFSFEQFRLRSATRLREDNDSHHWLSRCCHVLERVGEEGPEIQDVFNAWEQYQEEREDLDAGDDWWLVAEGMMTDWVLDSHPGLAPDSLVRALGLGVPPR